LIGKNDEKMTESEKSEAQQRLDDAFDFIFSNTISDKYKPVKSGKLTNFKISNKIELFDK
jgi:hypothetical protein